MSESGRKKLPRRVRTCSFYLVIPAWFISWDIMIARYLYVHPEISESVVGVYGDYVIFSDEPPQGCGLVVTAVFVGLMFLMPPVAVLGIFLGAWKGPSHKGFAKLLAIYLLLTVGAALIADKIAVPL